MGERAVRSMAYSISASIELRVPSTICSTIGSTAPAGRGASFTIDDMERIPAKESVQAVPASPPPRAREGSGGGTQSG